MKLSLSPDDCSIYHFWRDYLPKYDNLALLDLSPFNTVEEYIAQCFNPTARNRWRYSNKYYVTMPAERNDYLQQIHEINTSKQTRQGKPMRQHYLELPKPTTPDLCVQHNNHFFICYTLNEWKPVAYINAQLCGDLIAITQIMGHAEHLKHDVMLNLWGHVMGFFIQVNDTFNARRRTVVYSRWTDGTDGLRHWKYSVGLKPGKVEILP